VSRRHVAIVVLVLAAACASVAAEEMKIGVFEFGRLSQETNEGLRIQTELKEFQEKKQGELAAKEKELKDLQDKLIAEALSLSPERRAAMEKELQKKQNELQVAREGAQREWQIEFNEAQAGFQQKVVDIVEAIGREGGYIMILERDQCVFRSDTVDITGRVIERFNKMTGPLPDSGGAASGGGSSPSGE
jgi:outer membrane protein